MMLKTWLDTNTGEIYREEIYGGRSIKYRGLNIYPPDHSFWSTNNAMAHFRLIDFNVYLNQIEDANTNGN